MLSEKKILNETENHIPPLQVKWSVSYRPRSTRKRKTNVNDSNDLRHWTKDKYVKLLSEKGIEVDPTWKVDIVRQLYLANTNTAVERAIPNNGNPINVDSNQATDSAAVAADVQPSNSR